MNTITETKNAQEVSTIILEQLGGRKFIAMTGSKNFGYAVDANQNPYLQMKLASNKAKVNTLRITLNPNDTYTMHFSNVRVNLNAKSHEDVVKVTNEVIHERVYCDMLCFLFTKVTGLFTSL